MSRRPPPAFRRPHSARAYTSSISNVAAPCDMGSLRLLERWPSPCGSQPPRSAAPQAARSRAVPRRARIKPNLTPVSDTSRRKGLVVIHLDGLSHGRLELALERGHMPFVKTLIEKEGYEALPYRCGVPSTTPFAQAGILYGDNSEIPSYRWWDKEAGVLVTFGRGSSFKKVAHRYFRDCRPLTEGGAVIGSCYPAGAKETFGLAYRERDASGPGQALSGARLLGSFFASPVRIADWLRHGTWAVGRTAVAALQAQLAGRPAAPSYVLTDVLEEIFLHHVARYAVEQAMDRDLPIVYAGFYAYDETAHGFGPEDGYSYVMLKHVD